MIAVPVLCYHQVAPSEAVTPEVFEDHLGAIAGAGYSTVTVSELAAWMRGEGDLTLPAVAITFDDGFAATWTYAAPHLRRRGMRATAYVITSRVGEGAVRTTTDDGPVESPPRGSRIHKEATRSPGPSPWHCNWAELAAMAECGAFEVGSHGELHARYFTDDRVVGFLHEGSGRWSYAWATGGDRRVGLPVHPHKSSLWGARYYHDAALFDSVADYVAQRGGEGFFADSPKAAERELRRVVADWRARHGDGGRLESGEECRARILGELAESRRLIEERLCAPCRSLCWPWGEYTGLSLALAAEAGYTSAATVERGPNVGGGDPMRIFRIPGKAVSGRTLLRALAVGRSPLRSRVAAAVKRLERHSDKYV